MPANVETMMYVREKPWHGLGTEVLEAPTSADALRLAGLDWQVNQENVYDTAPERSLSFRPKWFTPKIVLHTPSAWSQP